MEADVLENNTEEQIDWQKDSDIIFDAITRGKFSLYEDARRSVVVLYIPDLTFSRAGICHALKRLKAHFTGRI